MSAFMASSETVADVLIALYRAGRLVEACTACGGIDAEELGVRLAELNAEALRQRYGDARAPMHPELWGTAWEIARSRGLDRKNGVGTAARLAQIAKNVSCFIYQCSEGSIGESPLYKLAKISEGVALDALAAKLRVTSRGEAMKSKAYNTAHWG